MKSRYRNLRPVELKKEIKYSGIYENINFALGLLSFLFVGTNNFGTYDHNILPVKNTPEYTLQVKKSKINKLGTELGVIFLLSAGCYNAKRKNLLEVLENDN